MKGGTVEAIALKLKVLKTEVSQLDLDADASFISFDTVLPGDL
jgi:hypothetical protein